MPEWGYTGFSVTAGITTDYGEHKTSITLHGEFAEPASASDLVQAEAEAYELAVETAKAHHDQRRGKAQAAEVPQSQAQAAAQVQQQTGAEHVGGPAPAPTPVQSSQQADQGLPTGKRPNGRGTFSYPPTSALSTEQLQERVREEIGKAGWNPQDWVVWDERIGANGLENGGERYSFASVKAANESAYTAALGNRQAFRVDLNDQNKIVVAPTKALEEAGQQSQQPAAQAGGF